MLSKVARCSTGALFSHRILRFRSSAVSSCARNKDRKSGKACPSTHTRGRRSLALEGSKGGATDCWVSSILGRKGTWSRKFCCLMTVSSAFASHDRALYWAYPNHQDSLCVRSEVSSLDFLEPLNPPWMDS
jgi:hypothetical protein